MDFIASFQLAVSLRATVWLGSYAVTHGSKIAAQLQENEIRLERGQG